MITVRKLQEEIYHLLHPNHASQLDWECQGFGMLRVYLDEARVRRLHVWHSQHRVPGVSLIHSHPWDFTSYVLAGAVLNRKYVFGTGPLYNMQLITPGKDCKPLAPSQGVMLRISSNRSYAAGDMYHQSYDEIHSSHLSDNTVTVVDRSRNGREDEAYVFWRVGSGWVSAQPRNIDYANIKPVLDKARIKLGKLLLRRESESTP